MANLTTLTLPAPGKVNLFLHITGQRQDGYHNLNTLFQFIDYGDTLHFHLIPEDNIEITGFDVADNLVTKAAKLLPKPKGQGVQIHLEKRLPIGAGLGGGSSNAATTLIALNYLWQQQIPTAQLIQMGKTLGADVPIFLFGQAAIGQGIGDVLTPFSPEENWLVVIFPSCQVLTQELFSHPDLTRNAPTVKIDGLTQRDIDQLGNHFTPVVRKLYPEVNDAYNWLNQFAQPKLSGTGASVFAAFPNEAEANNVLSAKPNHWHGIVTQGLNRSPLINQMSKLTTGV